MGESPSARTQRELAELRGLIDGDVDRLLAKLKADADPRHLVRRSPLAVLGGLGSLGTLAAVRVATMLRSSRQRKPDGVIDELVERLGGRVDQLKGNERKRLREGIRKEVTEAEKGSRLQRLAWDTAASAATAGAALLARRFASKLTNDDD